MKKLIFIAAVATLFACNKNENTTFQVTYTAFGKVFPYYVTYDNGIISNYVDTVRTTTFTKTVSVQTKNKVMGITAANIKTTTGVSDSLYVKVAIGTGLVKYNTAVFMTNVQGSATTNLTTPSR